MTSKDEVLARYDRQRAERRAVTSDLQTIAVVVCAALIGIGIALAANAWAADQDVPWFGDHPALTGILAFLVAVVLGRTYLFMRRLESR